MENLFFEPQLTSTFVLNREEAHHVKVLRLQEGDIFSVTDGRGLLAKARILKINREITCEITDSQTVKKPKPIHLAAAPVKSSDRMEWMVEKCVETGLEKISFFFSQHSERRKINRERLEKIAISAMKQSHQCRLPVLSLTTFPDILKSPADQKFIGCLCEEAKPLLTVAAPDKTSLLLIGPEGDFSPQEIQQAKEAGFTPVTLSENRLRTETAGLVGCCVLNLI